MRPTGQLTEYSGVAMPCHACLQHGALHFSMPSFLVGACRCREQVEGGVASARAPINGEVAVSVRQPPPALEESSRQRVHDTNRALPLVGSGVRAGSLRHSLCTTARHHLPDAPLSYYARL